MNITQVIRQAIDDLRTSLKYARTDLARAELAVANLHERIAREQYALHQLEHNLKVIRAA